MSASVASGSLCAVASWMALSAGGELPPRVLIEPPQDPRALCGVAADVAADFAADLATALGRLLADVEFVAELVAGSTAPHGDDLVVTLDAEGETRTLRMRDAGGRIVLERTIGAPRDGSCSALVTTAAFMIERRLQELQWVGLPGQIDAPPRSPPPLGDERTTEVLEAAGATTDAVSGGEATPDSSSPPEPAAPEAPELPAPHATEPGPPPEPPVAPPPEPVAESWVRGLRVGAAFAVQADLRSLQPGAAVVVDIELPWGLRVGARASIHPIDRRDVVFAYDPRRPQVLGELRVGMAHFLGEVGLCQGERLTVCGNAALGGTTSWVEASGPDIQAETTQVFGHFTAGATVSASVQVVSGLSLDLTLWALMPLIEARARIEGAADGGIAYRSPGVVFVGTAGAGWDFY